MPATLLAADLARVIEDAAIFAGRDRTLPMLNSVRLESSSKRLIAVATDRFMLGSSTAQYHEGTPGQDFELMLGLSQAQMLARVAKSTRSAFTDATIKATAAKVSFSFTSGEQLTLPKLEGTFPEWRKLIDLRSGDGDPTPLLGVKPAYLAKFAKVSGARQMSVKVGGRNKPILVSIGSHFVGLVMPVRLGDDDTVWKSPDWLEQKPKRTRKPRTAAA